VCVCVCVRNIVVYLQEWFPPTFFFFFSLSLWRLWLKWILVVILLHVIDVQSPLNTLCIGFPADVLHGKLIMRTCLCHVFKNKILSWLCCTSSWAMHAHSCVSSSPLSFPSRQYLRLSCALCQYDGFLLSLFHQDSRNCVNFSVSKLCCLNGHAWHLLLLKIRSKTSTVLTILWSGSLFSMHVLHHFNFFILLFHLNFFYKHYFSLSLRVVCLFCWTSTLRYCAFHPSICCGSQQHFHNDVWPCSIFSNITLCSFICPLRSISVCLFFQMTALLDEFISCPLCSLYCLNCLLEVSILLQRSPCQT
jgi:hypothetical protein